MSWRDELVEDLGEIHDVASDPAHGSAKARLGWIEVELRNLISKVAGLEVASDPSPQTPEGPSWLGVVELPCSGEAPITRTHPSTRGPFRSGLNTLGEWAVFGPAPGCEQQVGEWHRGKGWASELDAKKAAAMMNRAYTAGKREKVREINSALGLT